MLQCRARTFLLAGSCLVCYALPAVASLPAIPTVPRPPPPPPPCCLGCLLALLLQIFEVYGLGREVIDTAFAGTVSRIGGMSLADIQREGEAFWAKGFPSEGLTKLDDYGFIQSRPKGEYHANNQVCRCCRWGVAGVGGLGLGLLAW